MESYHKLKSPSIFALLSKKAINLVVLVIIPCLYSNSMLMTFRDMENERLNKFYSFLLIF